MTGFGRASWGWGGHTYRLEIKALNSKTLDLQIKALAPWSGLDDLAYKLIQQALIRGKISLQVWVIPTQILQNQPAQAEEVVEINASVLEVLCRQWVALSRSIPERHADGLFGRLVATHPMIFKKAPSNSDPDSHQNFGEKSSGLVSLEKNDEAVMAYRTAIESAIQECLQHRHAEGSAIAEVMRQYLEEIRRCATEISHLDSIKEPSIRQKIEDFWSSWQGNFSLDSSKTLSPDPFRLEQELLYYLEKKDIAEELVRLRQHLNFAQETLNSQEEQGRRLGFIAQEIGRELNTIGSKASDFEIQRRIVLAKETLEKIKEQSLNLL